jgi:exosome complex exonuclease RRP6
MENSRAVFYVFILFLQRYEKPVLREDSHMFLYRRNKKLFDNRQLYALRELYRWRDRVSREDDESIGWIHNSLL